MTKPPPFQRERLSERENTVLDLAIEGLTDIQIGLRLGIRPATVNSYWVRIRGKLGHYSRTELVAHALRQVAQLEIERVRQDHAALNGGLPGDAAARSLVEAAFNCVPEALAGVTDDGLICLTNPRFEVLVGRERTEIIGQPISVIFTPEDARRVFSVRDDPTATSRYCRLGIDKVLYVLRRNGDRVRVILSIDGTEQIDGGISVFMFRHFIDEIDIGRRRSNLMLSHSLARIA